VTREDRIRNEYVRVSVLVSVDSGQDERE